ncbi:MAG: GNAT family N-acetyltransferase [Prevotella sp.]|nr:GNAT family N-acetyltransferase [Prevotella sp.]
METCNTHSETTDIRLRAIEPEDLDLLYRIENDISLWNVGTTNVPYSRYTLHDYIASSADDIYADRQLRLIVENGVGETVGMADLIHFEPQHLRAEVGIVIMDGWRRKGLARQALRQLCDYALHVLHLHQLYAVVAVGNEAACRLFLSAGFEHGAALKDWLQEGHTYHDAVVMQRFL